MIRKIPEPPRATHVLVVAGFAIGLFAISTSNASAQTSGTWTNTGSLNTPRAGHTATLLPSGDVLVAGGRDATGDLASAELYTPATGMWTSAGSMSTPRISHSATLLGNGDVLVAGGDNATGVLASAELYTPATGQWRTTGSMSIPRSSHGATLLLNGEVLVAAGNNNGTSNTAELYDPSKGSWHGTGTMQSDHAFSLTLLKDGRALAVDDAGSTGAPGELYDPSSGQWSLTGALYYAHSGNSIAALANGEVLAYGNHFACYAAQIYNPTANTWSRTTGQCGTGISFGPLAPLATGKALLAGGSIICSGKATEVPNADLYDPSTNGWLSTGRLNQARLGHTLTRLLNGQVLAAGGSSKDSSGATTYLTSAELYTP
jgi:N-acetylneuraminic acid mutarotase